MFKPNRIFITLTIFLFLSILVSVSADSAETLKSDVNKVWRLNFTGLSLDPTKWAPDVKDRVIKTSVGTGYVAFLGASLMVSAIWFVFLYGMVRLDWLLVILTSAAYYGYKRGGKLLFIGAALVSYCYAFGMFSL